MIFITLIQKSYWINQFLSSLPSLPGHRRGRQVSSVFRLPSSVFYLLTSNNLI